MLHRSTIICGLWLVLVSSCSQVEDFAGGSQTKKDNRSPDTSHPQDSDVIPSPEPVPGGNDPNPDGEPLPGDPNQPNPEPIPNDGCPKLSQEILIIDLKSGWWTSNTASFLQRILGNINDNCVESISFEYHHLISAVHNYLVVPNGSTTSGTMDSIDDFALKSDWNQYQQIWLLSGSQYDKLDIKLDHPLLIAMLEKIAAATTPLFLASGNGNISHVNAMLQQMGLQTRFATDIEEGSIVAYTHDFEVVERLSLGKELVNHFLFSRNVSAIAETIKVNDPLTSKDMPYMYSDYLKLADDLSRLGVNSKGQPSIAVQPKGQRKMVLDAGNQRSFAIKHSAEKQTLIYLQNIALFLAQP